MRLVSNGINAAHDTLHLLVAGAERVFQHLVVFADVLYLLHRTAVFEVNRSRADGFDFRQPRGYAVHHIDFRRAFDQAAVSRQHPNRPCAVDGNGRAEADLGQLGRVVCCWKNVRKQDKLVFKLIARRSRHFEAVEVRDRH